MTAAAANEIDVYDLPQQNCSAVSNSLLGCFISVSPLMGNTFSCSRETRLPTFWI